jgi:hypothetical protein
MRNTTKDILSSTAKGAAIGAAVYSLSVISTISNLYSNPKDEDRGFGNHQQVLTALVLLSKVAITTAPLIGALGGAFVGAGYGLYRSMTRNVEQVSNEKNVTSQPSLK